jgi:hypothetical protein
MNRLTPLVFFSILRRGRFRVRLHEGHSVIAGLVAIPCGLPLLFLIFRASWTGNDDPGTPTAKDKARRWLA